MSFNNTVIELLKEENLSVNSIAARTALSINYVRTQLRHMEQAGIIERVDERLPIIYRVNKEHNSIKNMEAVNTFKKRLLTNDDKGNFVIEYLSKYPKSTWPGAIDMLAIASQALKELNDENKLVDTL